MAPSSPTRKQPSTSSQSSPKPLLKVSTVQTHNTSSATPTSSNNSNNNSNSNTLRLSSFPKSPTSSHTKQPSQQRQQQQQQQQQPQSSSSPTKQSSSQQQTLSASAANNNSNSTKSPKQKWQRALSSLKQRHLLDKKQSTSLVDDEEPRDVFGERLAYLLNNHQQQQPQRPLLANNDKQDNPHQLHTFTFPPLLSRHNAYAVWQWLTRRMSRDETELQQQHQHRTTTWPVVVGVLLGLLLLLTTVLHGLLVWSFQMTWYVFVYATLYVVDVRHVPRFLWLPLVLGNEHEEDNDNNKQNENKNTQNEKDDATKSKSPSKMHNGWLISRLRTRFAGREWTKDAFLDNPLADPTLNDNSDDDNDDDQSTRPYRRRGTTSQECTLWELPPPSVQQGRLPCLSAAHLAQVYPRWSSATVQHVVAIDYCHVMLREEQRVRQRRQEHRAAQKQRKRQGPTHGLVQEELTVASSPRNSVSTPGTLLRSPQQNEDDEDFGVDEWSELGATSTMMSGRTQDSHLDREARSPPRGNNSSNIAFTHSLDDLMDSFHHPHNYTHHPSSPNSHGAPPPQPQNSTESIEMKMASTKIQRRRRRRRQRHEASTLRVWDDDTSSEYSGRVTPNLLSKSREDEDDNDDVDLPWLDVGAKIGLQFLNSAHVHRVAASTETTERLMESSRDIILLQQDQETDAANPHATTATPSFLPSLQVAGGSQANQPQHNKVVAKPIHPLWTSANAAVRYVQDDMSDDISMPGDLGVWDGEARMGRAGSPAMLRAATPTLERIPEHPLTQSSQHAVSSPLSNETTQTSSSQQGLLDLPMTSPTKNGDEDAGTEVVPICQLPRSPSGSNLMRKTNSDDKEDHPSSNNTSRATDTDATLPTLKVRQDRHHRAKSEVLPQKSNLADLVLPSKRRAPLLTGVKVAVPIFPYQPRATSGTKPRSHANMSYQMGTVVSSCRIFVGAHDDIYQRNRSTNCLAVTVKLDKSFLRNGEFVELTFRVMDSWSDRYMPKHSKAPVGACVSTNFGLGVLVGWRVEDDIHVVRSLWQRRGPGASCAYLNRNAIHCVMEASIGFRVNTKYGMGFVMAYVDGGRKFDSGRFFVAIQDEGRHKGHVVELYREDILSCHGAQFIPVIEHIREAAHFQIQVDNYEASLRERMLDDAMTPKASQNFWQAWTAWADILWNSFLKAVEEDEDFDDGLNDFIQSLIAFLERLDGDAEQHTNTREEKKEETSDRDLTLDTSTVVSGGDFEIELVPTSEFTADKDKPEPGLWIVNDIFGGVFNYNKDQEELDQRAKENAKKKIDEQAQKTMDRDKTYNRIFVILKTLMRTISIARASSVEHPHLRLGLAIVYDVFLFVRTFLKVQQHNVSMQTMDIWNRCIEETYATFGPIKDRLEKIGQGIAQRMEKQGRRAKARLLKFADTLLGDERLLFALEQGDWDKCVIRIELALVKAKIIEKENLIYWRKSFRFVLQHIKLVMSSEGGASSRNSEKLAIFAQFIQWIAAPRRSFLKLFERNDVLEFFERILVRVFHKEELASRMLTIHASNFHSLRHLRLLKDFSTAGRLWMPVLDAADEEFSWLVSQLPESTKDFMIPIVKLFSLCVAHFHKIDEGDLTKDWMDFLFQDEAVEIVHEFDVKLILAMQSFARDVRETMVVLPYYSSIDDDLLGLMDEVDIDEFLREASEAIEDDEKLNEFIREKATVAIERFLNYLPRMSIPVEKRELMEGWVLTCRGEDGGDLTLSDVKVKRENLVCQILGGDALFFPMFGDPESETISLSSPLSSPARATFPDGVVEESILDHIRELILQAQRNGCWKQGVGGIVQPPTDRYVASVLQNLPISNVLNCGIELWRNLEIDDDELLEIAVRDVSYQIQLQKEREDKEEEAKARNSAGGAGSLADDSQMGSLTFSHSFSGASVDHKLSNGTTNSFDSIRKRRFNPRVDPTVFFLEMRNLTLNLDKFLFRIEKSERTILDPIFDGKGSLLIQNVSIRLRVDCAKERMRKTALGETFSPILVLRELVTSLEKVDLKVKDTGFGSDWLVNKAVDAFADDITKVVAENLREQIMEQVKTAIESLNSYFLVNPNMLLNLLGISMEDLDDHIVWV